ncbi:fluoride efflux transporter FluC [uncultured Microbacterium sp.]|uniref:fluoride efflux transporter FluC n=1 Tax=uncultured Microbacterium sp. TaxID=191216 RepID=UPI0035C969F5
MSPLTFLLAVVAGGVGAGLRYAVDVGVASIARGRFPWGIFVVNVSGSLALGLLTGAAPASELSWIFGVGLLGGYTTFSTVAVETWLLGEKRDARVFWANELGTAIACIIAAGIGVAATTALRMG